MYFEFSELILSDSDLKKIDEERIEEFLKYINLFENLSWIDED
jgi:hypothetical protein